MDCMYSLHGYKRWGHGKIKYSKKKPKLISICWKWFHPLPSPPQLG
jgi:hypothetical protein